MSNNESAKCSRQSSEYLPYSPFMRSKKYSTYEHMFLEDFCMHFSIILGKKSDYTNFYKIESSDEKLENLIEYHDYMFLKYDLDKLLAQNLLDLIQHGIAYIEVVRYYDNENNLVGIDFVSFRNSMQINIGDKFYYLLKKSDGQYVRGKIDSENVIILTLKGLGYSKRYFKRLFRKLKQFDISVIELSLNKNSGFDFEAYKKKEDFKLLKVGHDVCWFGRKNNNQYINEPYLLYIHMQELILKEKILNQILYKYNEKIAEIGQMYGFTGRIGFDSKVSNYDNLFEELQQGTKNCEQVSDAIYKYH